MLVETSILTLSLAILIGLIVGSFLNVVILRMPPRLHYDWTSQCCTWLAENGLTGSLNIDPEPSPPLGIVSPASHCPSCKRKLKPWHNLPVLSYLLLRGQCAHCQSPISPRYPVIETLSAFTTAMIIYHVGVSWQGIWTICLCWSLITLTFIDYDHHILPDEITLPLLWLGLLLNLFGVLVPIHEAVTGAISGYAGLWLVYQGFRLLTGKEGMGFGDFKLLAAIGAWLGWQVLPLVVLVSAASGSIVGVALIILNRTSRHQPIPFGPFLAFGAFVTLIWGEELASLYLGALT